MEYHKEMASSCIHLVTITKVNFLKASNMVTVYTFLPINSSIKASGSITKCREKEFFTISMVTTTTATFLTIKNMAEVDTRIDNLMRQVWNTFKATINMI